MKTINLLRALFAALVAFSLSSCMEKSTTISIKADGSGTVTELTLFTAEATQQLTAMAAQAGEGGSPLDDLADKEKAATRATQLGEGVSVQSIKKIEKDGRMGVEVVFAFKDIAKLKYNMDDAAAPNEAEGAEKPAEFAKFTRDGNKVTITLPEPKADPNAEEPPAEQLAMMEQMLAGMKMNLVIKGENGIAKTDATHHEGDTVTLMGFDFDQIITNEGGAANLKALNAGSREEMEKANKLKGFKAEIKEKITIELK